MLRAGVPEAPVKEYRQPRLAEDQVCCPTNRWKRTGGDPVPKPKPMNLGSQPHLGAGVPIPISLHGPADRLG
jgi:hypothetical protein